MITHREIEDDGTREIPGDTRPLAEVTHLKTVVVGHPEFGETVFDASEGTRQQ